MDKQYRENNIEKIKARKSEKITCECGTVVTKNGLSQHKKKKHKDLMETKFSAN